MSLRLQTLTQAELNRLHDASLQILTQAGICFNSERAVEIFKQHGFRTQDHNVYITPKAVSRALETTPEQFTVQARNPKNSITIGKEACVMLPTVGAPNIQQPDGNRTSASMHDFETCCKLVQTSDVLDLGGYLMVQPTDIPVQTAHMDMIATYVKMCDKPLFGASGSGTGVQDTINMAEILFGGAEKLMEQPAVIAVANTMSPLSYSEEQTDVIITMADYRQPIALTAMALAGSSGPVSLPGLLAMQNAEILGGLVLSQLVGPGTPVVYGSTSAPMDMRTTISAIGAPETVILASACTQLAKFYNLPCRAGGSLTDAHTPDAQSGAEGTFLLATAINNGVNFIIHSCGQLASYMSMSFVKWLIDEEICAMMQHVLSPLVVSDETLDVDTIISIGSGGEFLTHPSTFENYQNLSQPRLFNRLDFHNWYNSGARRIDKIAEEHLPVRLATYTTPEIDQGIIEAIDAYVEKRKKV